MKNLNRSIIGKWVTIKWDDIGREDCVIVDILDDGKITNNTNLSVFKPRSNGTAIISASQILEIRDYLIPC